MDHLISTAINGAILGVLLVVFFKLRVKWLIWQKKKAMKAEDEKRARLGY